jgi:hypothetical protein
MGKEDATRSLIVLLKRSIVVCSVNGLEDKVREDRGF